MSKKKREFGSTVSFRIRDSEKEDLEKMIHTFQITKSEFMRDWMNRLLRTVNGEL
jgi:hypothetical protein